MAVNIHRQLQDHDTPFTLAGAERLPEPLAVTLAGLNIIPSPSRDPNTVVLVVVTDQGGLGELTAMVDAHSGQPVAALYTGNRPSVAATCIKMGAVDVFCSAETEAESLTQWLHTIGANALSPAQAALEAIPVGIAIRNNGQSGYQYRNPYHRQLPPEVISSALTHDLASLEMGEVVDPDSGRVFLLSQMALDRNGRHQVLELLEDITGRHIDQGEIARQRDTLAQHAKALERANRELARLDHAKSHFIALAAHEVRTPLTAMTTAIHLIRYAQGDDLEARERFLGMVERNVIRLATLAENLLEFTQLETDHSALSWQNTDPRERIHAVAARLDDNLTTARLTLNLELDDTIEPLPMDQARFDLALENLIDNAIQRCHLGGHITLAANTHDHWIDTPSHAMPTLPTPARGWLELRIHDDGTTLNPQQVQGLFSPFGEGRQGHYQDPGGSPLGLAICHRVVSAHGGAIWVDDAAQKGITITVRLPRLSRDDTRLLDMTTHLERIRSQHDTTHLLVITGIDHEQDGRELAHALSHRGHTDTRFVALSDTPRVLGVIPGEMATLKRILRVAESLLDSSQGSSVPIKLGWAVSGANEAFRAIYRRACAAVRPINQPPHDSQ